MTIIDQNQLKIKAAESALDFVQNGMIIGVGTGSTVNFFIELLAKSQKSIQGAVVSSQATEQRLRQHGISIIDPNDLAQLSLYIDGADEIDPQFNMIKGGGGALTQEKIVAAISEKFICICDISKQVKQLGNFPLPIEVIPVAKAHVSRQLTALGGLVKQRNNFITDNGNIILDVHNLRINNPCELEAQLNQIVGIVTCGLFAARKADILICANSQGIEILHAEIVI